MRFYQIDNYDIYFAELFLNESSRPLALKYLEKKDTLSEAVLEYLFSNINKNELIVDYILILKNQAIENLLFSR